MKNVIIIAIMLGLFSCSEEDDPIPACQNFERGLTTTEMRIEFSVEVTGSEDPFYLYMEVNGASKVWQVSSSEFETTDAGTLRYHDRLDFIESGDVAKFTLIGCTAQVSGDYELILENTWTFMYAGSIMKDKSELWEMEVP